MSTQDPSICAISTTMNSVKDALHIAIFTLSTCPYFLFRLKKLIQTAAYDYLTSDSRPNTTTQLQIKEILDSITSIIPPATSTNNLSYNMNTKKPQLH